MKGLDSSFDGTPREVMHETLAFINDKWGSIAEYLDEIGFSIKEQRQLASVLVPRPKVNLNPPLPLSSVYLSIDIDGSFSATQRVKPISGFKQSLGRIGQQRVAPAEDSPPSAPRERRLPESNLGPQGMVSGEFYAILSQGCETMLLKQAEV